MMKSATTNYNKIKLLIILATLCNLILTQNEFKEQPTSRSLVAQSTQLFVPCSQDSDCNPPFIFCSNETKLCEHKPIFPIYEKELVGIVIIPLLLSLFSIAGLGGGGIIIPFSMIFFVFDTKNAIAISNFAIFTCSVTRYIYTLDKKHPHPDKKQNVIIEYNLAIVMLPTVMMGSLTGVFLNIIFPAIALQAILTALLIFLSLQSLMKGKDIQKFKGQSHNKSRILKQKKALRDAVSQIGWFYLLSIYSVALQLSQGQKEFSVLQEVGYLELLDLGGGAIFNPILIGLGTPPAVATRQALIGSFGATGGLALFNVVTKKYNRQSFIVFVLAGVMGASALLVPIFGGLDLMKLIDRGEDIFKMNSICK
eukprot:403352629